MSSKVVGRRKLDMLHGSLFDKLVLFAIPLAASSVLQQLFNSVDVAVVGKFASSQAQAAVGCNGSVINLILNLFVGISVGANVVIARYIGGNKKEKIKDAVHTAMLVAIVSGIILLLVGIFISGYFTSTPITLRYFAYSFFLFSLSKLLSFSFCFIFRVLSF